MKFKELKDIINRSPGRHDRLAIHIELGFDAIIASDSEILDFLDDYSVKWIAPSTIGVLVEDVLNFLIDAMTESLKKEKQEDEKENKQ